MWLRRFLRVGDFLARKLHRIGKFFGEAAWVLFPIGIAVTLVVALFGSCWYFMDYPKRPATNADIALAMQEGACLKENIQAGLKSGRIISYEGISDARDGCKRNADAAATLNRQLALLPSSKVQAEAVNRFATPEEIKAAASADQCVKESIPIWRQNIGGGPILVNDIPDIVVACSKLSTLNAQLAAIPK